MYQILMNSFKKLLEENEPGLDKEHILSQIKALEPFVERTESEIMDMYDVGAFNDIVVAYCEVAMRRVGIDKESMNKIVAELKWLFDTTTSRDIIKRNKTEY